MRPHSSVESAKQRPRGEWHSYEGARLLARGKELYQSARGVVSQEELKAERCLCSATPRRHPARCAVVVHVTPSDTMLTSSTGLVTARTVAMPPGLTAWFHLTSQHTRRGPHHQTHPHLATDTSTSTFSRYCRDRTPHTHHAPARTSCTMHPDPQQQQPSRCPYTLTVYRPIRKGTHG